MARRRASRGSDKPDYPSADGIKAGSAPGRPDPTPPVRRDFLVALLVLLAGAGTAFIWMETPFAAHLGSLHAGSLDDPSVQQGLLLTAIVWIVALAGLLGRLQARRTVRDLHAILSRDEIIRARLEPGITEEQSGLRMRYVSAWLVAILGLAASAVLWQSDAIERAVGEMSAFVVGATFSVALALAVAANTINRHKTRRLSRDFRTALKSERLALDTFGALNVMTSACLPTGERTRFNERFLKFLGLTEAQVLGRGWLEAVHADDRQPALDLVARPLSEGSSSREHDLCIRHRDGRFVWLRETLTPRFDEKGELIEFIGTAIDITRHIENVAALDKQIGDLKADLSKSTAELTELRGEHSKIKASRNRFEASVEESRDEVKNLQQALNKAEASLEKLKTDAAAQLKEAQTEGRERAASIEQEAAARIRKLEETAESRAKKLEETAESRFGKAEDGAKAARQELEQAKAEIKKLTRACETMQGELGTLRHQGGDVRDVTARYMKEIREAKEKTADAQASDAQHRARSIRLTQRCEELERQLAAKDSEANAARQRADRVGTAAAAEIARRANESTAEALATQLRRQLDGMQRMTSELLAQALDGPAKDAAHNTAASVRAMSDLVNQALSGANPSPADPGGAAVSFDLRRTVQGVRDLLSDEAAARKVALEVEVAPNVKGVHGDEIEIRTALLSLTDAALHVVQDGTLKVRLVEDVNTAAHSTIRCEISHASARVKNDVLEAAMAMKSSDSAMPDAVKQPVQHQAAKAWRTMRALDGKHGFRLPDEGGFSIWFTFTLGRPAASSLLAAGAPETSMPERTTASPAAEAAGDSGGSRSLPRMPQEFLTCNLGEVVELGADSARVYCAKPPKGNETTIKLEKVDFDKEIRCEVTWSKKISGRQHDVGLKFLGLTDAEQKQILRIAMQHRKVAVTLGSDSH